MARGAMLGAFTVACGVGFLAAHLAWVPGGVLVVVGVVTTLVYAYGYLDAERTFARALRATREDEASGRAQPDATRNE